ncbi:restriction endonuclease [Spirillospora sp. CA-253888]
MSKAWVIRAGRYGEREQWALTQKVSGGGWHEIPDLTECGSREDVAKVVGGALPAVTGGKLINIIGQMWALRGRIQVGDLLVMPLKTGKQIAFGRVTGGYAYLADEPDPSRRHVVRVDWQRTDLPRTAVKQDLLFTLGSALTLFAPSKNNAVARLEKLLATGVDPGNAVLIGPSATEVDEPELAADIEQAALDQITARVNEEFSGHGLATLVSAILTAEGFYCDQAPPGPDGGIDITAGRGPLGLDIPRLLAQIKSGGQIGSPVVTQLHGVMSTYGADQGLLVAWDGLTKQARDALKNQAMRVRVWEAADVVNALLRTYDRLPEEIVARVPLRRVWMLSDGGS